MTLDEFIAEEKKRIEAKLARVEALWKMTYPEEGPFPLPYSFEDWEDFAEDA